jgi:NuA3 HAT complex component NTO1
VQSEGYKPREERGWEEFHPDLDIDATFMVFSAAEVDGTAASGRPVTPNNAADAGREGSINGSSTPAKTPNPASTGNTPIRALGPQTDGVGLTPGRRRPMRPTRDYVSLFASRPVEPAPLKAAPQVLPIHNQTFHSSSFPSIIKINLSSHQQTISTSSSTFTN